MSQSINRCVVSDVPEWLVRSEWRGAPAIGRRSRDEAVVTSLVGHIRH